MQFMNTICRFKNTERGWGVVINVMMMKKTIQVSGNKGTS